MHRPQRIGQLCRVKDRCTVRTHRGIGQQQQCTVRPEWNSVATGDSPCAPPRADRIPCLRAPRAHIDRRVRGGFLGLAADTTRAQMTLAVLEGVAYAFADAQQALADAGTHLADATLIGGGARSPLWAQILADVLAIPLHQVAESDFGCALGAARLARMAAGDSISVARPARRLHTYEPRPEQAAIQRERYAHWQRLYPIAQYFSNDFKGELQ